MKTAKTKKKFVKGKQASFNECFTKKKTNRGIDETFIIPETVNNKNQPLKNFLFLLKKMYFSARFKLNMTNIYSFSPFKIKA